MANLAVVVRPQVFQQMRREVAEVVRRQGDHQIHREGVVVTRVGVKRVVVALRHQEGAVVRAGRS